MEKEIEIQEGDICEVVIGDITITGPIFLLSSMDYPKDYPNAKWKLGSMVRFDLYFFENLKMVNATGIQLGFVRRPKKKKPFWRWVVRRSEMHDLEISDHFYPEGRAKSNYYKEFIEKVICSRIEADEDIECIHYSDAHRYARVN